MSTVARRVPPAVTVVVTLAVTLTGTLTGCTAALRSDPAPVAATGSTAAAQPTPAGSAFTPAAGTAAAEPADLNSLEPVRLDPPEFGSESPAVTGSGGLSVISKEPNSIVDVDEWYRRHQLEKPSVGPTEAPADVPRTYQSQPLAAVLRGADTQFLLYGPQFEPALLVARDTATGRPSYAFDFARYTMAPEVADGESDYVRQSIRWAQQVGNVLYVSTGHRTYARSSGGMNAYLTAIDVDSKAVLWRSGPLVANAETFEVIGDRIVTGYGFTAEPDHLYVLDAETGAVTGGIPLASAPEVIREQDGRLLVRCYDTDYEIGLSTT